MTQTHTVNWWEATQVAVSTLINGLIDAGLGDMAPEPPSPVDALGRAVRSLDSTTYGHIVRAPGVYYVFRRAQQSDDPFGAPSDEPLFTIGVEKRRVDKDTTETRLRNVMWSQDPEDRSVLAQVRTTAKANRDLFPAGAVNAWLRGVVSGNGIKGTRVKGGTDAKVRGAAVYWVPPSGEPLWRSIEAATQQAGCLYPHHVAPQSAQATAEVVDALRAEVEELAQDTRIACMGDRATGKAPLQLTEAQRDARIAKLDDAVAKLRAYGDILNGNQAELEGVLRKAQFSLTALDLTRPAQQ